MGTVERFGDAEGLFCATNLVDKWFEKLSHVAAVKTDPQYNSYPWVGTDDLEVEGRLLGMEQLKKSIKGSKGTP